MKRKIIFLFVLVFLLSTATFALTAPSNFSAKADSNRRSVILSWSAVSDAVGYNVYRKEITDFVYKRLNFSPLTALSYEDKSVVGGKDYLYVIRSVSAAGTESLDSVALGAPLMVINTTAMVTTLRDKPLAVRSIKTGEMKTFAAPGDIITYTISYINIGYSSAKNVKINYDIPDGTVIAGNPRIKQGPAAQVSYFDKIKKKWVAEIEREENISRVRFLIPNNLPPLEANKKVNGIIDLNVLIAL